MGVYFNGFGPGITLRFYVCGLQPRPFGSRFHSMLITMDNEYSFLKSAASREQSCIYDEVAQQKSQLSGILTAKENDSPRSARRSPSKEFLTRNSELSVLCVSVVK
jgi:hypothetical protein